jgi:hypothetical protein
MNRRVQRVSLAVSHWVACLELSLKIREAQFEGLKLQVLVHSRSQTPALMDLHQKCCIVLKQGGLPLELPAQSLTVAARRRLPLCRKAGFRQPVSLELFFSLPCAASAK